MRPLGLGWQTTMLDLTLILFLVTAAALTDSGGVAASPPAMAALDNATSVWRSGKDAPDIRQWLAEQPADHRQRLTIVAFYEPGEDVGAAARAIALKQSGGSKAANARIVLQEGGEPQVLALVGYDGDGEDMARALLSSGGETLSNGVRP